MQADRELSAGDCVQLTAPHPDERIAYRRLGTVERIDSEGDFQIRLDSGRDVQFNIREHPQLDCGKAVTPIAATARRAARFGYTIEGLHNLTGYN